MHSQQRGFHYTTLRWKNILRCTHQGIDYGFQNKYSLVYHLLFHLFDLIRNKRSESKTASAALCLVLPANRGFVRHREGPATQHLLRDCNIFQYTWWRFPCYWPFVRGIHWSPLNFSHKDQWRGALVEQTIETLLIWDAVVLIMTSV